MNLKKCISIFIALLLLVSNVGFAFNVHYCGEEIESISVKTAILQKEKKSCCVEKAIEDESCCKDKVVNFQKKSDNTILKVFSFDAPFTFLFKESQIVGFAFVEDSKIAKVTSYFFEANAPPLFKLYSQYIFYA